MMVLGVNSKRQRRPNVRLGEIGDISAAASRGSSWKFKESWEVKKSKHERKSSEETEFNVDTIFPLRNPRFIGSDPGVSPRLDTYNRENRNPNSLRTVREFPTLESNTGLSKLNFGKVTRKGRLMKRRGRSVRESGIIGSSWNSVVVSRINNEMGKDCAREAIGETEANYDVYTVDEFNYPNEVLDMTKEVQENELVELEPILDIQAQGDSDEFWMENVSQERNRFSFDDGHHFNNKVGAVERASDSGTTVQDVRGWLEDLGFGKYAQMFEIHEVDVEALPLLTFEDLKEMGIDAVGPRRKIFTAIQNLKDRSSSQ